MLTSGATKQLCLKSFSTELSDLQCLRLDQRLTLQSLAPTVPPKLFTLSFQNLPERLHYCFATQ